MMGALHRQGCQQDLLVFEPAAVPLVAFSFWLNPKGTAMYQSAINQLAESAGAALMGGAHVPANGKPSITSVAAE
jgi:hypothetical protein